MVAHIAKEKAKNRGGRAATFKMIFFLNRFGLSLSLIIFTLISFIPTEIDANVSSYIQFLFGYIFIFSRVNEIFFAFANDAIDKLSHNKKFSYFKMRLNLAFSSYIELIFNFGSLYFLLSSNFIHPEAIEGISNSIDALYFSGVTITTLGYGDFLPTQWYTKVLSVYEVLCGFALLLVSFTIYTNRAMK
jgi:voltage-gated potassium channel